MQNANPDAVSHREAGFTMMELIVVMSLLAVLMAAVVPVYSASLPGIQIRTARAEIVAVILAAQENAVREGRTHRVYFNAKEGAYWVMSEQPVPEELAATRTRGRKRGIEEPTYFEYIDAGWGAVRYLPKYLELGRITHGRPDRELDAVYIACHPNGASDQAVFRFRDVRRGGDRFTIRTLGTLGKVAEE